MKILFAVILCTSLVAPVLADGTDDDNTPTVTYLDVPLFSHHSQKHWYKGAQVKEFNDVNPGLGVTMELSEHREFKGGCYLNSYKRGSCYAGVNVKSNIDVGSVTLVPGISIGAITGYAGTTANLPTIGNTISAVLYPTLAVHYNRYGVVMMYAPKYGKDGVSVFGFELQYRLQ